MSNLRCPEHGWGVGELGCLTCDEKNNTDNPYEKLTVQFGKMGEFMDDFSVQMRAMTYYWGGIQQVPAHKIVGSVV